MRGRPQAALMLLAGTSLALLAPTGLAAQTQAPPSPALDQPAEDDAVAGFQSAGDLLHKCRQSSSYAKNFCFAYLAAVADATRAYTVWIGAGDTCLPARLTMGKLADTFEAYLIANPSQTEAQAASVIVASLQESYPCPKAPPQPRVVVPDFAAPPAVAATAPPRR
ncbi:Rap1a/Tai family immunity protein [Erythrobacter sp. NE805]|uniref:Rap1a/Tai family immunity protein n=1 Tax=Erythrobacter sp. NE805 TaxID=3389875 RepID=UPI00396B253C